ncbi:MAG: hypothetical protein KJ041_05660 [Gammaproteobacteria bacterium]|nr:hypothetical protein [Gammaproteobacteria bacterium]
MSRDTAGEQISAWLDDELPPEELELLAARLVREPEQRSRLARYALIGSVLRDTGGRSLAVSLATRGLAARVGAALDEQGSDEPSVAATTVERPRRTSTRLLPAAAVAGLGLAVFVLVAVLRPPASTGIPVVQVDGPDGSSLQAGAPVPVAAGASATGSLAVGDRRVSLSTGRLTNYLVYHGEYSGGLSARVTDSHIVSQRPYAAAMPAVERVPAR